MENNSFKELNFYSHPKGFKYAIIPCGIIFQKGDKCFYAKNINDFLLAVDNGINDNHHKSKPLKRISKSF